MPEVATPGYADVLLDELKKNQVKIVAALPDSLLKQVYRLAAGDPNIRYIQVTNESELPGIVVGAYLGGKRAVMIMENSGLRQAAEPIARLALAHNFPMVMIMSHRGGPGEPFWWGHSHAQTMEPMLRALRIPYWWVNRLSDIGPSLGRAFTHADSSQFPVALIFGEECTEGGPR